MIKPKKKRTKKLTLSRVLKFTETVLIILCGLYVLNWIVSVVLISLAIFQTGNFAYLDTLIMETNTTFRDIVGVAIIKFGVENIFKYNNFGGKVQQKSEDEISDLNDGDSTDDNITKEEGDLG